MIFFTERAWSNLSAPTDKRYCFTGSISTNLGHCWTKVVTIDNSSPLFASIRPYSSQFATVCHCSRLFATICTIWGYSHYSYYSLFAIHEYSLFGFYRHPCFGSISGEFGQAWDVSEACQKGMISYLPYANSARGHDVVAISGQWLKSAGLQGSRNGFLLAN